MTATYHRSIISPSAVADGEIDVGHTKKLREKTTNSELHHYLEGTIKNGYFDIEAVQPVLWQ